MKKTLLVLTALLILSACSKKEETSPADTNVHITGNVKGFKKGKLFLTRVNDTAAVVLDTINIDGTSQFESHIKLDSPEMLYLVIDRVSSNSMDDNLPVFAQAGNIKIETSLDAFYFGAKVTGSKNHDLYTEFLTLKKRITDTNLDITEKELMARKKNNVAQIDSLEKSKKNNEARLYLATANFAVNHATFDIAPYLAVKEIPNINMKYLLMIEGKLSPEVKKSFYGKQLAKLIAYRKETEPAAAAPVAPAPAK